MLSDNLYLLPVLNYNPKRTGTEFEQNFTFQSVVYVLTQTGPTESVQPQALDNLIKHLNTNTDSIGLR